MKKRKATASFIWFIPKMLRLQRAHRKIVSETNQKLQNNDSYLDSHVDQDLARLEKLVQLIKHTEPHSDQQMRHIVMGGAALIVFLIWIVDCWHVSPAVVDMQLKITSLTWKNTHDSTFLALTGNRNDDFHTKTFYDGKKSEIHFTDSSKKPNAIKLKDIQLPCPAKVTLQVTDDPIALQLNADTISYTLDYKGRKAFDSTNRVVGGNYNDINTTKIDLSDPERWNWPGSIYAQGDSLDFTDYASMASISSILSGKIVFDRLKSEPVDLLSRDILHVSFDKDVLLRFSGNRDTINLEIKGNAGTLNLNGKNIMPTELRLSYYEKPYWFYIVPIFLTILTTLYLRPRRAI